MDIPTTVQELAKASTPTWILITILFALPIVVRHILILALAFRNSNTKRLGVMYLIVCLTDIIQLAFIAGLWIFKELIIKISFI